MRRVAGDLALAYAALARRRAAALKAQEEVRRSRLPEQARSSLAA